MIELVQGDITELQVDAVVNAANSQLQMGGGVAGAIRRKGGPTIQKECDKIGHCPVGDAVITNAGNLKARFIIHAVGPVWGEGNEDQKLSNAVMNSLKLGDEKKLKTIALPAISTGIFGFPMDRAAKIILETASKYSQRKTELQKIIICLWDKQSFDTFNTAMDNLQH